MNYATYLRQLPQGLVAIAVSFAVLPTLSAQAATERTSGDGGPFVATLAQGLRLVTVLIIPASVGLYVLARPTVALLYEHGSFTAFDTSMTAQALQYYLLGLPFAGLDLLLVFAFYARQDTLTPSLIGVATVLFSLVVAFALMPAMGLFSLMVADSAKLLLHTIISALLLGRRLGGLRSQGIIRVAGLTVMASAAMGAATFGAVQGIEQLALPSVLSEVLAVGVPSMVGVGVYLLLITLLGVEEIKMLWGAVRKRIMPPS